jgi:hypothetical protein
MILQNNAARPAAYSLSEEEINDPYLVIDELFDFAELNDARELLWEWLKVTVTGTYHKNLGSTERAAIITMYEKMEKLLEAAHVLHEKTNTSKKKAFSRKGAKGQRK